ncbi:AbrB family transcriptional regulator [Oscillatoria sp. FACHB-1407]|uniref:AbrB family transcriptional regulator n=1 Tax=Oscillatoria sp. FACHB-1407 TaxID=2692847 RepID=UPI001689DA5E|nr:AbrB family transcriptional regulator [Oscillatoria sp. FACHB-1407]MBD2459745.1 AbrB family transcriptional regulator [Oscillatoria sp. FACHB-1407]
MIDIAGQKLAGEKPSWQLFEGNRRFLITPLVITIELLLAAFIGLGFIILGLNGAAWVLGGIAAGAIAAFGYRALTGQKLQPNRKARKVGQMIIGLAIGLSLQHDTFNQLSLQLPLFLGLPLFLVVAGGVIGMIYSRLEKTDMLTAILATTPGNIGVMVSIAADFSKNTNLVSLVQLMRFTSVILVMPLIANVAIAHSTHTSIAAFLQDLFHIPLNELLVSSAMVAIAAVVVYIGDRLKLPMAAFLGAIGVGLLFEVVPLLLPIETTLDLKLPLLFNLVGQVLLGVTIGEYWGINGRLKWSAVARSGVPIALMFVAGGMAACIIHAVTHWNWLTCLLIAAPGGSPEMIWIALTLHQDSEIVTTGHVVRLLMINLSLPLLIGLATYLERRLSHSSNQLP